MAVTSFRQSVVTFTGDVTEQDVRSVIAANGTAPGLITISNLVPGNNTITLPTIAGLGFNCNSVTIIPPVGNTDILTLKGVNGDTGIPLHKTDPTIIALDPTTFTTGSTFVISNAGAGTKAVRMIWA